MLPFLATAGSPGFLRSKMAGEGGIRCVLESRMSGDDALRKLRHSLGRDPETGKDLALERLGANQDRVTKVLANLADTQDDRINFRINSAIKEEFDRLCRASQSSLSRELKRFMVEAIRKQRLF